MNQSCKDEKKAKREENRKRMPNVAKLMDDLTKLYGRVRVIGAEDYETGVKVGNLDDD